MCIYTYLYSDVEQTLSPLPSICKIVKKIINSIRNIPFSFSRPSSIPSFPLLFFPPIFFVFFLASILLCLVVAPMHAFSFSVSYLITPKHVPPRFQAILLEIKIRISRGDYQRSLPIYEGSRERGVPGKRRRERKPSTETQWKITKEPVTGALRLAKVFGMHGTATAAFRPRDATSYYIIRATDRPL